MKYGARAIVWGHKVMKGKVQVGDVPSYLTEKVGEYLTDKGWSANEATPEVVMNQTPNTVSDVEPDE